MKPMETVEMTIEKARRLAKAAGETGAQPRNFQRAFKELAEAVLLLADEVEQLKSRRS
jgi:hypothetical protein